MRGVILIAEDDRDIRLGLRDLLEGEGYQVRLAEDGIQALDYVNHLDLELAILDIMMPGKSGYEVCGILRAKRPEVAILMLTAKSEEIDKVAGLRSGADDYLTKPFGMYELLARVEALLRRVRVHRDTKNPAEATSFTFGRVVVDPAEMRIRNCDQVLPMTARELSLLQLFRASPHHVLSRDFLLDEVWGIHYTGTTRTLDQHIAQLRKKLENAEGSQPISTVHGMGYRYEPTPGET